MEDIRLEYLETFGKPYLFVQPMVDEGSVPDFIFAIFFGDVIVMIKK